jgi:hypothetical protein
MSFWHPKDSSELISTEHPVSYADRLRIRQPGDAGFALGAHVDGGSVERWEPVVVDAAAFMTKFGKGNGRNMSAFVFKPVPSRMQQ